MTKRKNQIERERKKNMNSVISQNIQLQKLRKKRKIIFKDRSFKFYTIIILFSRLC